MYTSNKKPYAKKIPPHKNVTVDKDFEIVKYYMLGLAKTTNNKL